MICIGNEIFEKESEQPRTDMTKIPNQNLASSTDDDEHPSAPATDLQDVKEELPM